MSIPHRCPICEGRGEVGQRLAQTGAELISKKPMRFACHGCNKTGIVWDQSFVLNLPTIQPNTPWVNPGPTWGDGTVSSNNALEPIVPIANRFELCLDAAGGDDGQS